MVTYTKFDGVHVQLFQPILYDNDDKLAAVIYFHGGGFVTGDSGRPFALFNITNALLWVQCKSCFHLLVTDIMFASSRRICEELNVMVASVNYRLAPQHKFPAAFEDALKATKWLLVNANQYNVNPNKVAVLGDSSGGSLSAAVSQFIKDDPNVPNLLFQALIYPITQQIDVNLPSAQQYHAIIGSDRGLCRHSHHDIAIYTTLYAFGEFRKDFYEAVKTNNLTSREFRKTSHLMQYVDHDVILNSTFQTEYYTKPSMESDNPELWNDIKDVLLDVRMSPLLREDMGGLPPAWIATCEFDPYRDDGILYANRLVNAGVRVNSIHYEGGFHGVWMPVFNLHVYQKMLKDFIIYAHEQINLT
ncbi:neutral cholesterol ester hydrolase 1-like [Antedon mediterranea]|uniref:neutral cholesterol ester hydrolase 1-like n=1 Tax=Antedon mediterranea TaxID=105859 RepID=UPI003AF62A0F